MARSALAAALLLTLIAGVAAKGGGGRGNDNDDGRGGGGGQKQVTTAFAGLSADSADSSADSIMAGDTVVITGRLSYQGDGPSDPRTVTCTDTEESDVSGTGQAKGEKKFSVSIPNVVAGSRVFTCSVPAMTDGSRRHLLQQTVVYAAASDTATVLVDEGGTAAPTPVTAPPPPVVDGTCNLDAEPSNEAPQTNCGVTGLRFRNFMVVPATGAYEGTEADGSKVLTNEGGDRASLVDRRGLFDLSSFYIANPNADSGLTVKINPKCATGSQLTITLAPDQGPTLVTLGFVGCTRVTFVPKATSGRNGRKLQRHNGRGQSGPRASPTSFVLDNLIVTESATPSPPPSSPSPPPNPPPSPPPSPPPAPPPSPPPMTQAPTCDIPESCNNPFQYRGDCSCQSCLSPSSPFKKTLSNGDTCLPPITLSGRSKTCSPVVLAAFLQSSRNARQTVRCIDPDDATVNVLYSTSHSTDFLSFFNQNSIRGSSLRLDGNIPQKGGNGKLIAGRRKLQRSGDGNSDDDDNSSSDAQKLYTFIDTVGKLKGSRGQVVEVTGSIVTPGNAPDFCFVSYLRVCRSGERPE